MTKYRQYYEKMVAENKDAFKCFQLIHDTYALDPDKYQEEYNREGEKILTIIREWEDKLCRTTEKGGYSQYSGNLAEKFQDEVRKHFAEVDKIGIKVKPLASRSDFEFLIRKIKL